MVTIMVARSTSHAIFGAYALVYSCYLIFLTITRGMVGGVTTLRIPSAPHETRQYAAQDSLAAGIASGALFGLILCAVSLSLRSHASSMLLVLGIGLPFLVVQDSLRFLAFSLHRPGVALANDSAWLGAQTLCFAALQLIHIQDPLWFLGSWAACSATGVIVGGRSLHLTFPSLRDANNWFRNYSSTIRSLTLEYLLLSGVAQGSPLLVGAVAGLPAVGSMRAALTLFGPITAASSGMSMATVPESARRWGNGDPRFFRPLLVVAAGLTTLCFAWAVCIQIVPMELGRQLLGDSWTAGRGLSVATSAWLGVGYLAVPAVASLRITGRNWMAARIRLVAAPLSLSAAGLGAYVGAALGAVVALSAATLVSASLFWHGFYTACKGSRQSDVKCGRSPD